MQDSISVRTPAKINLSLDILGKKQDGYHFLKSIMQTVSIYDDVTVKPNGISEIRITCDNPDIPCDSRNLVYKAAIEFFSYIDCVTNGIDVDIIKRIPPLAGLAGGSSDAAGMIVALNALMETDLTKDELCDIGAKVGSDVPFCIIGSTALAEGVGDIISPLPNLAECYFVIVKPDINISTPEAFKRFDSLDVPKSSEFDDLIAAIAMQDIEKISSLLFNALEYASNDPKILKIKDELTSLGSLGALMSGSGSAVYGIFEKKKQASRCADELKDKYSFVEVCTPVITGAEIIN